jgi:hypothetical protein
MVFSDDIFSKLFVPWDVDPFLPGDYPILVFLPGFLHHSIFCTTQSLDPGDEIIIQGLKNKLLTSKMLQLE